MDMLRRIIAGFILSVLLLVCTPALAFNPSPGQPATAVFYPDEIEVSVEERLKIEELPAGGTGFLLALPSLPWSSRSPSSSP